MQAETLRALLRAGNIKRTARESGVNVRSLRMIRDDKRSATLAEVDGIERALTKILTQDVEDLLPMLKRRGTIARSTT